MSAAGIDWEQLPDAVVEAFSERLHLVEMLLDPLLPAADKRAEQRRYQQPPTRVSRMSAARTPRVAPARSSSYENTTSPSYAPQAVIAVRSHAPNAALLPPAPATHPITG